MGGGHGAPGEFHPHGPTRGVRLATDVLATSFWLFVLFMAKEKGPYQFVRRDGWKNKVEVGSGQWLG